MEENKPNYGKKSIYKNAIWSLAFKMGSSFISFFSAPMLLFMLGEEKYGAWAALGSLVSWIYYFDIGIGGSMRNKVAASIAEDDYTKARKYVGVSYITVAIISAVLFLVVLIITKFWKISDYFEIRISGEDLNYVLIIAFLYACINFIASLVNNILYAVQRSATVSFFGILAQILFLCSLGLFAVSGIRALLWIAVGEGTCQLVKSIIESVYVYKKYPELRFSFKDIEWSYSKGIMSLGLMMFIGQITALILNATDNLIISKYIGVINVTPYNFCYKYFNVINTLYVALITPLLSAYTMAYTKRDVPWIKKTAKKNSLLYIMFLVGTIIAIFIFKPFSSLWLQKELNYSTGLIMSTAAYFLLLMFNHIWSTILTGFGRIKESTLACVIGMFLNIPVSIILATKFGLGTTGVILGSVISLLPNTIISPIIAIKEIKKIH